MKNIAFLFIKQMGYILFVCHLIVLSAYSQSIEISSTPNPVGSGARAVGMGGAFIAIADDATAASWNPGGIVQLEKPELSFVVSAFHRKEKNNLGVHPESSGYQSVSDIDLNYFSVTYPFVYLDRNMVVSLNYQHLYDFKREWDFPMAFMNESETTTSRISTENDGGLSAIGIAYGIQFTPNISFGLSLNIWDSWPGKNKWSEKHQEKEAGIIYSPLGSDFDQRQETEYWGNDQYDFNAVNVNLGVMWELNHKIKLGVVFKSPFKATLEHDSAYITKVTFKMPGLPDDIDITPYHMRTEEELVMPMSYGLGVAYAYANNLRFSMDIHRTHWNNFVLRRDNGVELCPLNGQPTEKVNIKQTHQVRMGMEYNFIKSTYVTSFRSGLFYDPAPAQGNPDDYYGFSLGLGIKFGSYAMDTSYQFRFGNDVGDTLLKQYDFSQDVQEHTFLMSFIYYL